jgi:hypothetical protein
MAGGGSLTSQSRVLGRAPYTSPCYRERAKRLRCDVALEECARAADLFQDREFPWAMNQFWEFVAGTATAVGQATIAERARAHAAQARVTSSQVP